MHQNSSKNSYYNSPQLDKQMYKKPFDSTIKSPSYSPLWSPLKQNTITNPSPSIYNYPSHLASPYQSCPASPGTPELHGTIIDNPDWYHPTSIRQARPFGCGQATSQWLANVARQAGRIAMAWNRNLFKFTIAEANWAFSTINNDGSISPIELL